MNTWKDCIKYIRQGRVFELQFGVEKENNNKNSDGVK